MIKVTPSRGWGGQEVTEGRPALGVRTGLLLVQRSQHPAGDTPELVLHEHTGQPPTARAFPQWPPASTAWSARGEVAVSWEDLGQDPRAGGLTGGASGAVSWVF